MSFEGRRLGTVHVPTNEMTTSFSSKSELAINLSTNGHDVSFSGYDASVGTFDASNSNTPGTIDASNPDLAGPFYRTVGDLNADGRWTFTDTNSYSGDNERADLLDSADNSFFAAGNSNNGNSSPIDPALVDGTGAQNYPESFLPQSEQNPVGGTSIIPMGAFNIDSLPQYSTVSDKAGKDTNFRGLTVYNNVVYYTKGSGSNGINTVYFVDTSGTACPATGVGSHTWRDASRTRRHVHDVCAQGLRDPAREEPRHDDPAAEVERVHDRRLPVRHLVRQRRHRVRRRRGQR